MNYTYSIDKITLKGRYSPFAEFPTLSHFVDSIVSEIHSPYVVLDGCYSENDKYAPKPYGFRYWVTIGLKSDPECVFYLSYNWQGMGADSSRDPYRFQCEFNPNKNGKSIYSLVHSYFDLLYVDIVKYDVAYDIKGYSTCDVFFAPNHKATYMSYGTSLNKTYYLNPKNSHARIKVYNKGIERGIDEKILRIEITSRYAPFWNGTKYLFNDSDYELARLYVQALNSVYVNTSSTQDPTLVALSYLDPVQKDEVLACMSHNTRDKYRKLMKTTYENIALEDDYVSLHTHLYSLLSEYNSDKYFKTGGVKINDSLYGC